MVTEATPNSKLRIHFFPFPTSGHFFPLLNFAARLSSTHSSSISATIITTPSNSHLIDTNPNLSLKLLPLPPSDLPPGWDSTQSPNPDFHSLQSTLSLLEAPLHDLLKSEKPHCLVSDSFLPFTSKVAQELHIPRIMFNGMGSFAMSVMDCIKKYRPHDVEEEFEVPGGLPEKVVMRREQLPEPLRQKTQFNQLMLEMEESQKTTYGILVNSFLDLESGFGQFLKGSKGGKAWLVGPISSSKNNDGANNDDDESNGALAWLDTKEPGSVLYACFGSSVRLSEEQLVELAHGLTGSNRPFVWVVKQDVPASLLERNELGIVIQGWAPQVRMLNHGAVGGFLTHCGWNSVLEAVTAGKGMVTWPVFGDQPFNEKLVVDVLGLGARVHDGGIGKDVRVKREQVVEGIRMVMEGTEIKERARRMGEKARVATEEGGSSWEDVNCFVQDLMSLNGGLFV